MMALDQGQRRIDDPRQAFREAVADLDVRHPDMMRAA
jgi:hypothetical protein